MAAAVSPLRFNMLSVITLLPLEAGTQKKEPTDGAIGAGTGGGGCDSR